MTRTTQEVFHARRLAIETNALPRTFTADRGDDAVPLTPDGTSPIRAAIQGWSAETVAGLPRLIVPFDKAAAEGDTFLLQLWSEYVTMSRPRRIATVSIRDDKIQRQAEWFLPVSKEGKHVSTVCRSPPTTRLESRAESGAVPGRTRPVR